MKTITKVALASSVGLMLCGAVMCAVGAGMGGRAAAMELTDLSPYMSLRNGLTVGYDAMDDLSKEGDYELKFDSSDVSNVNIEIGASDVKITEYKLINEDVKSVCDLLKLGWSEMNSAASLSERFYQEHVSQMDSPKMKEGPYSSTKQYSVGYQLCSAL